MQLSLGTYDLFASARKALFSAQMATGVHRLRNKWSSLLSHLVDNNGDNLTRPIGKFTPSPSTVRPLFPARPFPCISPLSPFWIAKHCLCVIYPSVFLLPFLLEPISLDNQLLHTAHLYSVSSSTKFVEHFVRIYCKTHSFLTYKLYLKLLLISSHMARIFLLTLYYSKFCESQYQ